MNRPLRNMVRIVAAVVALTGIVLFSLWLILPSAWFREKVRERIVYEVEKATGGRVEIGSFYFDWKTLTAEVSPFVLHGTEGAGQQPLARVDRLKVGLKII